MCIPFLLGFCFSTQDRGISQKPQIPIMNASQFQTNRSADVLITLKNERDTRLLGEKLFLLAQTGDCLFLIGDLGAGKTTLARGFIQAAMRAVNHNEAIPSPTFTLVQSYDQLPVPIAHFDLYRIETQREIEELGFDDAVQWGVVLVEWPDRLQDYTPEDRLEVHLHFCDHQEEENQPNNNKDRRTLGRRAELRGFGNWRDRLLGAVREGKLNELE